MVTAQDCGTENGLVMMPIVEGGDVLEPLRDRVLGRMTLRDAYKPGTEEVVIPAGTLLDEHWADVLEKNSVDEIWVRSPITCELPFGICAHCYGRDLARGHRVNIGESVGVIAAQSIGEPGTQLTMRTFTSVVPPRVRYPATASTRVPPAPRACTTSRPLPTRMVS